MEYDDNKIYFRGIPSDFSSMRARGKAPLFLVFNYWFLFVLLLIPSGIRGTVLKTFFEENYTNASSELSPLTESEPEDTYESLMNRLNLKPFYSYNAIDFEQAAEPRTFAKIIARYFSEAHFHGYNNHFMRYFASDNLVPSEKFDERILYKIMQDREIMDFLGLFNCFRIIEEVIRQFQSFVTFDTQQLEQLFRSIGLQLCDFLEFILEEFAPRYPYKLCDPKFNIDACAGMEYPTLIFAEHAFPISKIALFRDLDILRVIVRRFASIWPVSSTKTIIQTSIDYFKHSTNYFRQVLTLMVRFTPEYFILPDYMKQYKPVDGRPWHFCALMSNMAPILRALMMVDSANVQDRYLDDYSNQIKLHNGFSLQNDLDAFKILNYFIKDSKFSIVTSEEMFGEKKLLFSEILERFFGFEMDNYYTLIRKCIRHNYLPLFEAILQFLSVDFFTEKHRTDLLIAIIHEKHLKKPLVAISIAMGYLDFEDFVSVSRKIGKSRSAAKLDRKKHLERQSQKVRWIREIHNFLISCPISSIQSVFDSKSVPWPCPDIVRYTFTEKEASENYMKLFYYAQVILCKYFKIPFYNGSQFEPYLHEAATWKETISYINLTIEMLVNRLGHKNKKLFKFIDTTTEY